MAGKFFARDSKLTKIFETVADLIVLNFLAILCCLPIITAGASLTALYSCVFRLRRQEEGYLLKDFFRDFKNNFKQATAIWLLTLVLAALMILDLLIFSRMESASYVLQIVAYVGGLLVYFGVLYALPLQARFVNKVRQTIKNAYSLCVLKPLYAIFIALITALPIYLSLCFPLFLGVYILLGASGTAWLCSYLFDKVFEKVRVEE